MARLDRADSWPLGLWDRARARGFDGWNSYMDATALEEVLLDIEGALDDRLRSGEDDLDRLRRSLGISVFQAFGFHGMEEQRQAVDVDPLDIMIRWALSYGLTEVASRLRRLIAKLRATQNDDPPKVF